MRCTTFVASESLKPGNHVRTQPLRIDVLPVMFDEGLEVLVTHLTLQPVEGCAVLKHQGGERVPGLFQGSVRYPRLPHDSGPDPEAKVVNFQRTTDPVRKDELAAELEPAGHPAALFEQRVAHAGQHLDIADASAGLWRTLAVNREAPPDRDNAAVEEHVRPSQTERLASPHTREEQNLEQPPLPAQRVVLGSRFQDVRDFIRSERAQLLSRRVFNRALVGQAL